MEEFARREQRRNEIAEKVAKLKQLPRPPSLIRGGDSIFLSQSKVYPTHVRQVRVTRQEQDLSNRNARFLSKQMSGAYDDNNNQFPNLLINSNSSATRTTRSSFLHDKNDNDQNDEPISTIRMSHRKTTTPAPLLLSSPPQRAPNSPRSSASGSSTSPSPGSSTSPCRPPRSSRW
jgi:hypothetical protein